MNDDQLLHLALEIIGGLLSTIGIMVSYYLSRLTKSVEKLNLSMPVMIEKVDSHERRIEKLERRK